MGLVAPHFQSFGIDGLAAASIDPILVPDFNIAPAAILDIGRLPDFGRNGGATPAHAVRTFACAADPAVRRACTHAAPGRTTRQHFGRQDPGRQDSG
jgi:hypothetical protein